MSLKPYEITLTNGTLQMHFFHFHKFDQWSECKQCLAHCTAASLSNEQKTENHLESVIYCDKSKISNLLRQRTPSIYQPTSWWASWLTAPITHLRQFKWICDQCKYIFHTNLLSEKAILPIILNNGDYNSGGSIFREQLLSKISDNSSATNAQINLNKKSCRLGIIQTNQLQPT